MPTSPPFSYVTYTITAPMIATPEFSYATIGLLDASTVPVANQLEVYLNGTLLTITTDYTFIAGNKINVSHALSLADFLKIQRNTEKGTRYVDFQNNAILNEADLDLSANQIFYIAQEAFDLAYSTVRLNSAGDAWDGQGLEAQNFAPAARGTSLVTLNQVSGMLLGTETATIDGCRIYGFEGDGVTVDFPLDSGVPDNLTACQVLVAVDGVLYEADCAAGNPPSYYETLTDPTNASPDCGMYTVVVINGVPNVRFTVAPIVGASVVVRSISGTINTTVTDASITNAKLADGSVDENKLGFAAVVTSTPRFIKIDNAGVATVGTASLSDIANSTTDIRLNRLDQMAAPTANVSLNSNKITSLAAGTVGTDAVNKTQMDAAIAAAIPGTSYHIYTSTIAITDGTLKTYTPANNTPFDLLIMTFKSNGSTTFPTIPMMSLSGQQQYTSDGASMAHSVVYTNNGTAVCTLTVTRTGTGLTMQRTAGTQGMDVRFTYITFT